MDLNYRLRMRVWYHPKSLMSQPRIMSPMINWFNTWSQLTNSVNKFKSVRLLFFLFKKMSFLSSRTFSNRSSSTVTLSDHWCEKHSSHYHCRRKQQPPQPQHQQHRQRDQQHQSEPNHHRPSKPNPTRSSTSDWRPRGRIRSSSLIVCTSFSIR